jgi:drug/metabolite transporter (DMT)-like permease
LNRNIAKSHLFISLATLIIAGSFLVSEKLSTVVNPVSLTLLRFLGSAVMLLPVVLFKPEWRRKIPATLPRAMVISLFYALFFICLFESLKTTTSLNTGTLYTLVPFTTAFLSFFIFKETISRIKMIAYLFGVLGTTWVIFDGQLDMLLSFSLNTGDLIFLVGAASMCFYSISMKLLYRDDHMLILVFCILVGGSIWMGLAAVLTGQPLQWHLIKGYSILHMLYLIILSTLITVYLYQKATVELGPSRVMAYVYLSPALVGLLLILFEQVAIPLTVLPGILISVVVTIILQKDPSLKIPKEKPSPGSQ